MKILMYIGDLYDRFKPFYIKGLHIMLKHALSNFCLSKKVVYAHTDYSRFIAHFEIIEPVFR